jgi:protein arginine N-methyltransferase 1
MYNLAGYGEMMLDSIRMNAYEQALSAVVQPNAVVLDIGTGTGIMALIACRLGARRVYAIESGNAIQVAREIAAENGYKKKIVFIQDISTRVSLPEPVDVMVSDLRGVLPFFENHILSIIDARTRFLAEGGIMIPMSDTLWAAPVEAPKLYQKYDRPWQDSSFGFTMRTAQKYLRHVWRKGRVAPEQLVSDPICWMTIDYRATENPNAYAALRFTVKRAGQVHGYAIWFDALLTDEVCFSNAPGQPETIYGSAFFPFMQPVTVKTGDILDTVLQADLVNGTYLWRWHTRVLSLGRPDEVKAEFKQSTFYAQPFTLQQLHQQEAGFVPRLTPEGHLDMRILTLLDGKSSLKQIADQIAHEYPEKFQRTRDAFKRIAQIASRYGRQEHISIEDNTNFEPADDGT